MIFKKSETECNTPLQVAMSWDNREEQEAMRHASLFQVASHLTEIWHVRTAPESPEAIVDTFARVYQRLEDWYRGGPLKMQIKEMLDTLYPDPPGFEPGETLLPRDQEFPVYLSEYYQERQKK